MKYEFQKEFFVVYDLDTKDGKLFHLWTNLIHFLTDEVMKGNCRIIYDEDSERIWRAPKSYAECFDTLWNVESLDDLNEILEDLWWVQLVHFED